MRWEQARSWVRGGRLTHPVPSKVMARGEARRSSGPSARASQEAEKLLLQRSFRPMPPFYGIPRWVSGKESACPRRRCGFDPWVREDPLEEGMATHSSILA